MDAVFFQTNLTNPATLVPAIQKEWATNFKMEAFRQYNPAFHNIYDPAKRPKKQVQVSRTTPATATSAEMTETHTKEVDVNRIGIPLQKLIVSRATAFLTGGTVNLQARPLTDPEKAIYKMLLDVWRKNKMQFRNANIARGIYAETEAAEIWYTKLVEGGQPELRCRVYTPSEGYALIPVFDNNKDLMAFGLGYDTVLESVTTKHLDVYTDKARHCFIQTSSRIWQLEPSTPEKLNPLPLPYGKIPVIYYSQAQSIWADVQPMIERLETLFSNFGDTNDYNGSPILFVEGTIEGFSQKGETGKVLVGTGGAKVSYVSWDQAPEAIKLEAEMLSDYIFSCTQTPNISFKEMRNIGDISGVAFDRVMIDAILKAMDMQNGIYGEGIQRRCNFILAALAALFKEVRPGKDLEVTPSFGLFKIDDEAERIDNAMKANGGLPIIGWAESIKKAGVSEDPEATYNELQAEADKKAAAEAAKITPPVDPNNPAPEPPK